MPDSSGAKSLATALAALAICESLLLALSDLKLIREREKFVVSSMILLAPFAMVARQVNRRQSILRWSPFLLPGVNLGARQDICEAPQAMAAVADQRVCRAPNP